MNHRNTHHANPLSRAGRSSLRTAIAVLALVFAPGTSNAVCDCTTLPTLGSASLYPALGLGNIPVTLVGSTFANSSVVAGNIGVTGSGGSVEVQGAAGVAGIVGHEPGSTVTCTPAGDCPSKILGGIVSQDMSGPEADLRAASAAFAAMAPTQTYGNLTNATSIGGNGCINVIQINGEIDLNGTTTISLTGTVDDYFVINVTGDFLTSGNAEVVLDGLDPSQVIFNLVTPGATVELGGDSGGNFTILNPDGSIYLHGNSGGRGAYYAGATELTFQGNTDFFGEPFGCNLPACPDPEFTGSNIQTPATAQGRSLGNASFFNVFFDLDDLEGHVEHYRLDGAGVIKDQMDVDAIDPMTDLFKATRDPYWDAAVPLRSNASRNLYTTLGGVRDDFDPAVVTNTDLNLQLGEIPAYPNAAALGIATLDQLRAAIMAYVEGLDAFDADTDTDVTEFRQNVLGSIFHSNTLMLASPTTVLRHDTTFETFYQDHEQRDRAVYAGANDGMLHAFDAGSWYNPLDPTAFDAGNGAELFGYVPGNLLEEIKLVPRTGDATGTPLKRFFVDGNLAAGDAWLGDGSGTDISKSADEWATVLIAAFREGGLGYLALDVTDPTAGAASPHFPYPKLLWEFSDPRMGQSWSRPVITRVKLAGTAATGDHCGRDDGDGDCRERWVAIIGGGHVPEADPNDYLNYEDDPASPAWNDRSKAIFMIALDTGEVLAQVAFDATGVEGPDEMVYSLPSPPGVFDIDNDQFADIVLIGDSGGQMWKWDIHAKGVDSDADPQIDNWSAGVFFNSPRTLLSPGGFHYRSFYFPPSAALVNGGLVYTFGTGERRDLLYAGDPDPAVDDNNRFYVVRDPNPLGAGSIPAAAYTEADLTDVTSLGLDTDLTDLGYFIVAPESEKFVTDSVIFAGYVITASFVPDNSVSCDPGQAFLSTLKLSNAAGFFDTNATPEAADRRLLIGSGVPSPPRISVAPDPTDDVGFINTSEGEVLTFDPPPRDAPESSLLYWRQKF